MLKKTIGCVRLIYNKALAAKMEAWYERQESISWYAKTKQLPLRICQCETWSKTAARVSSPNTSPKDKLARAISDCGWGELVRQLEYKCQWYGRTLVKIDRYYPSSKRCSNCGYIAEKMPLSVREWDCPNCCTHHDRDENATKNILAAGLTVTVCGATQAE